MVHSLLFFNGLPQDHPLDEEIKEIADFAGVDVIQEQVEQDVVPTVENYETPNNENDSEIDEENLVDDDEKEAREILKLANHPTAFNERVKTLKGKLS